MKKIVVAVVLSVAVGLFGQETNAQAAGAEAAASGTNAAPVAAESSSAAVVPSETTNAVTAVAVGTTNAVAGSADSTNAVAATANSPGEPLLPEGVVKVLEQVLGPVGRGAAWLIDQAGEGIDFLRNWCAEKTGVDKKGTLYFILFTAVFVGLFVLVWKGVKQLHANARCEIGHWAFMRFLALASGFLMVLVSLAGPREMGQAVAIPLGALALTALIAVFVGKKTSFGVGKAVGLVLADFLLGLLTICVAKVLLAAVAIVIGLVIILFILSIMGGGSSSRSRPSRTRMRCRDCGYEFYGSFFNDKCPQCGSKDTVAC